MTKHDNEGRPLLAERTEDLSDDEVITLYQSSLVDDRVVKLLIDKTPRLLVGSRGTGKSMLLRYANAVMARDTSRRCFGIHVNFSNYLQWCGFGRSTGDHVGAPLLRAGRSRWRARGRPRPVPADRVAGLSERPRTPTASVRPDRERPAGPEPNRGRSLLIWVRRRRLGLRS